MRHVNYDSATDQPADPNEAAYSISGLLTLALAEIKSLRQRVAELEGGNVKTPEPTAPVTPRRRPR